MRSRWRIPTQLPSVRPFRLPHPNPSLSRVMLPVFSDNRPERVSLLSPISRNGNHLKKRSLLPRRRPLLCRFAELVQFLFALLILCLSLSLSLPLSLLLLLFSLIGKYGWVGPTRWPILWAFMRKDLNIMLSVSVTCHSQTLSFACAMSAVLR